MPQPAPSRRLGAVPTALLALFLLAATPALAQGQACGDGSVAVSTYAGDACIPAQPLRVVTVNAGALDLVLSLGITPVGTAVSQASGAFSPHLVHYLDGVVHLGRHQEPNLELLLSLQPDLIVGALSHNGAYLEQLQAIAPVVFTEDLVQWQRNADDLARWLGREEQLAQLKARYRTRIDALRRHFDVEAIEVSVARFIVGRQRIMLIDSFIGNVLADVGFARPASQQARGEILQDIDLEQIDLMDGDVLFIGASTNLEGLEAFRQSPLWQTLGVVQRGQVFLVDDVTWSLSAGYLAAESVMDDLLASLSAFRRGE